MVSKRKRARVYCFPPLYTGLLFWIPRMSKKVPKVEFRIFICNCENPIFKLYKKPKICLSNTCKGLLGNGYILACKIGTGKLTAMVAAKWFHTHLGQNVSNQLKFPRKRYVWRFLTQIQFLAGFQGYFFEKNNMFSCFCK